MGLTFILFARFVFHDCDADMNNDSWEPVVTEPLTGTGEAGTHDGSLTFKLSEYFRKFPHKYLILFPNSMMIVWFIHGPCLHVSKSGFLTFAFVWLHPAIGPHGTYLLIPAQYFLICRFRENDWLHDTYNWVRSHHPMAPHSARLVCNALEQ